MVDLELLIFVSRTRGVDRVEVLTMVERYSRYISLTVMLFSRGFTMSLRMNQLHTYSGLRDSRLKTSTGFADLTMEQSSLRAEVKACSTPC